MRGTLLGLILIPVIFYTLGGVFGKTPDWINIAIFFISAAAAYIYETQLYHKGKACLLPERTAFALLCGIGLLFILFTFSAPEIGLFRDPLTGTYGIPQKR